MLATNLPVSMIRERILKIVTNCREKDDETKNGAALPKQDKRVPYTSERAPNCGARVEKKRCTKLNFE
jgi:hypothetical protein